MAADRSHDAVLAVDDRALAACVACGLCLPHCPTWRVTGREALSPRGRIAAMRAVQWDGAPLDASFAWMMETCVQCRGCEPACPAFVPFGRLMESAREALAQRARATRPWTRRIAEWLAYAVVLPRHWLLVTLSWGLWLAQRVGLVSGALGAPGVSARSLARPVRPARGGGEPAYLFVGCVMDAWMRDVHRAAVRVMEAAGGRVELPGRGADCCGALHLHAGRVAQARRLASRVMESMPGETPVVVDSAGCAAAMKDYGRLVGTDEAHRFAARVHDVHEWLAGRPALPVRPSPTPVVVQDPCHLRHVQRITEPVRRLLGRAYDLRETGDDGLCCGAGGAYAALQPGLARQIRDRKIASLRAAGGDDPVVASANPGCIVHLRAAGVRARHPVELLADALDG